MKWIGISGSWRKTNEEIEEKIRATVREIFEQGNGMVSGGALGVDYIATGVALKLNPEADRIKIFFRPRLKNMPSITESTRNSELSRKNRRRI